MNTKLSKKKIAFFVLSIAISVTASYFGQSAISDNANAINVLVTMYSVLAGILIAIITVIGDPSALDSDGSWRKTYLSSKLPIAKLSQTKVIFYIYLLTLLLIFVAYIIPKNTYPQTKVWIEHGYVFLATMALLYSFKLPAAITEIQKIRINNKIKEQRKKDGIKE